MLFSDTIPPFQPDAMKKTLILFATVLLAMQMQAQDTLLLDSIKRGNSEMMTLKALLHNHNKKSEKITEKNGEIHYAFPDKFSAVFENESYIVFNGDYIKANIGIFRGSFRMRNGPVRSLSRAFLYALQGRCQDLAEENNFTLQLETDELFHTVTFTTKKKLLIGIGLKQAIFRYDYNSLLLKEIVLIDYTGSIDTYTLLEEKHNEEIDESIFEI